MDFESQILAIFDICSQSKVKALNILWPFSWTFGLAYSSLNFAKLSFSSEVMLALVAALQSELDTAYCAELYRRG